MKTKFTLVLAFVTLLCNAQGLKQIEEYTLDNGLTVILNPDHTKSEVFGYVVCKAGGKDDPSDATGMAHYMEHMLFKGTTELGTTNWEKEKVHIDSIFMLYDKLGQTTNEEERLSIQLSINEQSVKANEYAIPNEFSNVVKMMGGTGLNANTSEDRTVYFNTFPPNQMEVWLDLYSHRLASPVFRSFQSELEVVYEEKNLYSDQFFSNILEKFQGSLYKNHPYGQQTVIGTVDDLKNPSLTKMKTFYDTWYVPNNMALVLTGDFEIENVKPLVNSTFGKLQRKEVPERKQWEEVPFVGREFVEVKMSPIKLGMLGFRTVPSGHPDELALQICNGLLSNESQSGLLDQLSINNEVLEVGAISFPNYDYGASLFIFVPKIIGQSLEEAEQLLLKQVEVLKQGDFEQWRLDAIKAELYRQYVTSIESNENRGVIMGEMFAYGGDLDELVNYPELFKAITKEDIVAVANKYYGDNYLAFHSKMGSFKGEKIEKPNYEPVQSNTAAKSSYTKHIESLLSGNFTPSYLNFDDEVQTKIIDDRTTLYCVKNPVNDVFDLSLAFNIGSKANPILDEAAELMNDAYTANLSTQEIKSEFAKLGATFYISADKSYTYVDISGLEKNLDSTLLLVSQLINAPLLDQSVVERLTDNEKAGRKMELEDISSVSGAAFEWVRYGQESSYLSRLSLKEISELTTPTLLDAFKNATTYAVDIHYVGQHSVSEMENAIANYLPLSSDKTVGLGLKTETLQQYSEDVVYFVNKKGASQAELYFFINDDAYDIQDIPARKAFNLYFGGGFTGIVLQEVREYRSLAYSASAGLSQSIVEGEPTFFYGYIGTQADKTIDALEIFNHLVDSMPQKRERMDMMQSYLPQSHLSARPSFRGLSEYVTDLKHQGITEDPAKLFTPAYKTMTFDDIVDYYSAHVQNKPMVTLVVGDKKKIDMKSLKQYGQVIVVKEKDLFIK